MTRSMDIRKNRSKRPTANLHKSQIRGNNRSRTSMGGRVRENESNELGGPRKRKRANKKEFKK